MSATFLQKAATFQRREAACGQQRLPFGPALPTRPAPSVLPRRAPGRPVTAVPEAVDGR